MSLPVARGLWLKPLLLRAAVLGALVATSLLPDTGAAIPRLTYYFRDFTVAFYPLRAFSVTEISHGRWPWWNPFVQEGAPALPALYPLDLLQALAPGPVVASWLLALHFPIAALAAFALMRDLGVSTRGAFLSGAFFALGGVAVSSLNLYVFLQALALTPLVALVLRRAAVQGGRWVVVAAVIVAVSLTTLAVEFVVQGVVLGLALAWADCRRIALVGRSLAASLLGAGLAGVPLLIVLGLLGETTRGAGFAADVALGNAVHPAVALQVLLPNLFGLLAAPAEAWWASRFFSKGFPYFISVYLGPLALGLSLVGLTAMQGRRRWVLLALTILALWYSLGTTVGLAQLVATTKILSWFRFPCKALLLPYSAGSMLAGFAIDDLAGGKSWRLLTWILGSVLVPIGLIAGVAVTSPMVLGAWLGAPPGLLATMARAVRQDACVLGCAVLLGLLLCGAVRRHRSSPSRASGLIIGLTVASMAYGSMGTNPQVPAAFFRPLPEMQLLGLREGGRTFSYGLDESPAFGSFMALGNPNLGLWSFFLSRQILAPYANVLDRVETVESKDLTGFLLREPEIARTELDPRRVGEILTRLRSSAVERILSLDPLDHPELHLLTAIPTGVSGLSVHVYEIRNPWPRAYLACRAYRAESSRGALAVAGSPGFAPAHDVVLEGSGEASCLIGQLRLVERIPGQERYDVESDGPGYLVVRQSYARGWEATIDGRATRVLRANGKHAAVPIHAGRQVVALHYRPPLLGFGIATTLISMCILVALFVVPPRRRRA